MSDFEALGGESKTLSEKTEKHCWSPIYLPPLSMPKEKASEGSFRFLNHTNSIYYTPKGDCQITIHEKYTGVPIGEASKHETASLTRPIPAKV